MNAKRKAQDRKQQQQTAFLWRDRKNNPQENCSGWIKDLESEKADCCCLKSHFADMTCSSLHTQPRYYKRFTLLGGEQMIFPFILS